MNGLSIEDKIIKAKIWLLTKRPWFGQLSCYINLKENKHIPTAGIDLAGNLYYNPEWCKKFTDEQLRGLLCHEILHLALLHLTRCNERDKYLWNIAADLKVNIEIQHDQGIKLPPNGIVPNNGSNSYTFDGGKIDDINDLTAENCYTILRKHMKKQPQNLLQDLIITSNDPNVKKELEANGIKPISSQQAAGMSRDWQSRVYSASQMAKGDMPAGVARELFKLEHSELPWNQILKQRMRKLAIRHSWKKPSKRYLPWYFPGRTKNEGIKVVAAIDTSGSMSREQITKAVSELYGLMRAFQFIELWVTDCDAEVYNAKKVRPYELAKLLLSGGGGTDFNPVFDWIKKEQNNNIDSLLFFTDLYGDFPSKKPPYETFWITDTKNHDVPFGRKLLLEPEDN